MRKTKGKYSDPRWRGLRLLVLKRDKNRCVHCGYSGKKLVVHHRRYNGKYLWDTHPDYLITLCDKCHSKEHELIKTIGANVLEKIYKHRK